MEPSDDRRSTKESQLSASRAVAAGGGGAADGRRATKESTVSKLSDWSAPGGSANGHAAGSDDADVVAAHFVHQPWHRRFGVQFAALFWKNLLVQWRNWRSTVLRVLAPL